MVRGRRPRSSALGYAVASIAMALLPLLAAPGGATSAHAPAAHTAPAAPRSPAIATDPIQLSATAAPTVICEGGAPDCPAGVGESRVALTAQVSGGPAQVWPDVQVAFVIDTTSYAGDYGPDSPGTDPCVSSTNPLCEESNGIPFFVAHAGLIASEIQAANPHSKVTFALVDYYDAWGSGWDDQDGPEYHVDIGSFVGGTEFQSDVDSTFVPTVLGGLWYNWDQDMDNNFLDSSSITALYGAIVGSALDWSPGAHHVIVWMGVTAPRAAGYQQNYCVSASSWLQWSTPTSCYSQSCEPSYDFPTGSSPQCEGWVQSEDGNATHSVAALARTAPACVNSAGGRCVVDIIDLWTTSTDPYSKGWPLIHKAGGGPGGSIVTQNVERVLAAGCAMAAATGGTWNGPSWYVCPDGTAGGLEYVAHGSIQKPYTNNPTLLAAFRAIGFGPVSVPEALVGTNRSMFLYVPGPDISISPTPDWTTSCATPSGYAIACPREPLGLSVGEVPAFGWNWSDVRSRNVLTTGDVWTAQFNVIGRGPAGVDLAVDACATLACRYSGGGPRSGLYTWIDYQVNRSASAGGPVEVIQSFPPASVRLQVVPGLSPGPPPLPPAPPVPPAAPIPSLSPVALPQTIGVLIQTPTTVAQFQALAAGALAAGFTRIGLKNKPIAQAVAALSSNGATQRPPQSRFG